MSLEDPPRLVPGRVYRTSELREWSGSANVPRLAKRLVQTGQLVVIGRGLFACAEPPPTDEEILRAFLDDTPFVITGPERWNALGLDPSPYGSIAVVGDPIVYNRKRTGRFVLGGRVFHLRRVVFPETPIPPTREWYAVDFLEHAEEAGTTLSRVAAAIAHAVIGKPRRLDPDELQKMMASYGSHLSRAYLFEEMS
jgi:hypothetical protein